MATIGEVMERHRGVMQWGQLVGCIPGYEEQLRAAFRAVGEAIMEENGADPETARNIPLDTPLGAKAEAAYQVYCALIEVSEQ